MPPSTPVAVPIARWPVATGPRVSVSQADPCHLSVAWAVARPVKGPCPKPGKDQCGGGFLCPVPLSHVCRRGGFCAWLCLLFLGPSSPPHPAHGREWGKGSSSLATSSAISLTDPSWQRDHPLLSQAFFRWKSADPPVPPPPHSLPLPSLTLHSPSLPSPVGVTSLLLCQCCMGERAVSPTWLFPRRESHVGLTAPSLLVQRDS